jgi:hypothetical protein
MKLKPRGQMPLRLFGHYGDVARPGCEFIYAVTGFGSFPEDMLRYDVGTAQSNPNEGRQLRSILIRAERCTPARWESFGWKVHGDNVIEEAL